MVGPRSVDLVVSGTVWRINCVDRGALEKSDDEDVGLCAMCWQWRVLPADYFPRYINELTCSQQDTRCLAGMDKTELFVQPFLTVNETREIETHTGIRSVQRCISISINIVA